MGTPLTDAQFIRLLDSRLRYVIEDAYNDPTAMIPTMFDVIKSDSSWEEFFGIGAVPEIPDFNGVLETLSIAPGYHTKIEPNVYAGKIQMQRRLIDNKKYAVLDAMAAKIGKAARKTAEKHGASEFSDAFTNAFTYQTSEENVSLCSDSHTTKSGTSTSSGFDNSGTSALSKTTVASTRIAMKQFRNDISDLIDMPDDFAIVIPPELEETAYEIVKTPKSLDTAEGNVNFHYGRYDIIVWPRLSDHDANNWFMVSKGLMKEFNKWIEKTAPETKTQVDFNTYMTETAVYLEHGCGFLDWRWIYGHAVS